MFVETVFESSFGFTYVLFGAVVALRHEVCPSDMYFQVRQFFPHGY